MEKNLLSIITPCFNGEAYLHRLCDSILKQTYPFVEFIFINDGSTDKTEEVILSYKERFLAKGYVFKYILQPNGGQAKALNIGLKMYQGEFLSWPDSDDYYKSEFTLEMMVDALKKSDKDVSSVRSFATMYDELSLKRIGRLGDVNCLEVKNLFMDCLLEKEFWFAPICYMVKSCYVEEYIGNEIEVNRIGQNFQMFLPLFYSTKTITLREEFVAYLVRKASHSRDLGDFNKRMQRFKDIEKLKIRLIDNISSISEIEKKSLIRTCEIVSTKAKILLMTEYKELKSSFKLIAKNTIVLVRDFQFVKSFLYLIIK